MGYQKDEIKAIRELAKGIASDVRNEAEYLKQPAATGDNDLEKTAASKFEAKKREMLKWANQTENADRVSKTIQSAESDSRITCFRNQFDQCGDC